MSLVCIDESSNEHQILREIYQDPYAISTVKLLQITNRQHQTKGLPDFLILTNENIAAIELTGIAAIADTQWKMVKESITKGENDSYYAYAYMTPNLVESLDGDLKEASLGSITITKEKSLRYTSKMDVMSITLTIIKATWLP